MCRNISGVWDPLYIANVSATTISGGPKFEKTKGRLPVSAKEYNRWTSMTKHPTICSLTAPIVPTQNLLRALIHYPIYTDTEEISYPQCGYARLKDNTITFPALSAINDKYIVDIWKDCVFSSPITNSMPGIIIANMYPTVSTPALVSTVKGHQIKHRITGGLIANGIAYGFQNNFPLSLDTMPDITYALDIIRHKVDPDAVERTRQIIIANATSEKNIIKNTTRDKEDLKRRTRRRDIEYYIKNTTDKSELKRLKDGYADEQLAFRNAYVVNGFSSLTAEKRLRETIAKDDKWIKENPTPAAKSSTDIIFDVTDKELMDAAKEIEDALSSDANTALNEAIKHGSLDSLISAVTEDENVYSS